MQIKTDSFEVMKKSSLLLLIFVFLMASCLKREEYSDVPSITYKSFTTSADSAVLLMDFVDGDGNFGITESDTSGIYDDCFQRYNLYSEYYELRNGVWTWVQLDPCIDQLPFYYQVPFAEPTGQFKTQKGQIEIVMKPTYYLTNAFDTCRFVIKIADRDRNFSNTVTTRTFVKPI
jgi:hypothetical protein